MKRSATAVWNGSGKEGKGTLSTQSSALKSTPYTYKMRFGDDPGTNPEELMAAAHAACYTMKLSFVLGAAGFTPDELETQCTITMEEGTIKSSHLVTKGKVPGITAEKFTECAEDAKLNCPVSKAYAQLSITLESSLG